MTLVMGSRIHLAPSLSFQRPTFGMQIRRLGRGHIENTLSFVLGGRTQPSLAGDSPGKPWGILLGNSGGLASVIDHEIVFCIMTNM